MWSDADVRPEKLAALRKSYLGSYGGVPAWIVNGKTIRRDIEGDFVYGGNRGRYPWMPDEVWVDDAIQGDREEVWLTLLHELDERELMVKGWSYEAAHQHALEVERRERRRLV